MAIYAPARRINPSIQRTGSDRKDVYASLFLTSMVDMFAILVIFLLQSFSSEGELIVLLPGLELPKAENVGSLERAPSLVISRDVIMFEGVEIAKTEDVRNQEGWEIEPLMKTLKDYQNKIESEFSLKPPTGLDLKDPEAVETAKKELRKMNISADRRLEFQIVKKIIYNASYVGFPDFRFAVFAKGNPDIE